MSEDLADDNLFASSQDSKVESGSDLQGVDSPMAQRVFIAKGVAPGISMGIAHVFASLAPKQDDGPSDESVPPVDAEEECARFEEAVGRAERQLEKISEFTREKLGQESADIFNAQRLMLRDQVVFDAVLEYIVQKNASAEHAVSDVLSVHHRRLAGKGNDFLRERVSDLADVQDRLLQNLRREQLLQTVKDGTIVVANRLSAADLIRFSRRDIQGCIIGEGGTTSHVAIIARSLGIPTVMSAQDAVSSIEDGQPVVLDARRGRVIVHPSKRVKEAYRDQLAEHESRLRRQRHWRHHPAQTTDGRNISLQANVEFTQEAELLEDCGAQGVGLFRTEMLLMISGIASISEEESYQNYRKVVEAANPHHTTVRLLDLGGDKLLPRAHREHNPFLGWRGIRVLLDKPDILRTQLRATLRAASHGKVRILLPMIMDLQEVKTVRQVLFQVENELEREGIEHARDVPIGIMVEVPSVALQAELFASHVDFFSIGTNDLTQYVLAVDRGNDLVSKLFAPLHPSILRLIRQVVEAGSEKGIPVCVCGELAGDPRAVPVLIGLGITELSASPAYLPEIKQAVRSLSYEATTSLANDLLLAQTAHDVEAHLASWIKEHAPRIDALTGRHLMDEVLGP